MGKLVLFMLLIMFVLFTIISLTMWEKKENIPEEISQNLAEIHAGSLSEEALNFGIKKLKDGSINLDNDESVLRFTDFNVMNGTIDSIQFSQSSADTILIRTHVSYQVNNEIVHRRSSALINYIPSQITSAIAANGAISIRGNALVEGEVEQNCTPPIDFEEILGLSKSEVRSMATNYYIDPPNNQMPVNTITWVDIVFSDDFHASNFSWNGSGLFIIDGDATFTGGTFYGVVWVTGTLKLSGNIEIAGAMYAEGGTDIDDTVITGRSEIIFNAAAVAEAIEISNLPVEPVFEMTSWFDESD